MSQVEATRISAMPDRFRVDGAGGEAALLGVRCRACSSTLLGTARFCRRCTSEELEQVELSRRGTLHSYTVVHRAGGTWSGPVPYALAEVLLPEGVLVASRVVDWEDGEELEIGAPYELTSEVVDRDEEGNEIVIYRWRKASGSAA
jgi:uncharacterized OB-fold protein